MSTPRVTKAPGMRKSKNLNPSIPFSIIIPFRTRLVEVPIKVMVPPATAAKDIGRRNSLAFHPCEVERCLMLGISSATIGVLLTKPLSSAVKAEVEKRKDRSELPNLLSSRSILICLSTPVKAISAITVSSEGLTAAP